MGTMVNHSELRALADAAVCPFDSEWVSAKLLRDGIPEVCLREIAFITSVSPSVVLALLDELDEFKRMYGAECGRSADLQRRLCAAISSHPSPCGEEG